jgi:metal-dependent amidase/aminoacylase/carboxypeptidase family protein
MERQACGHDMHITSLLAAGELLSQAKNEWQGTLILCFQPAEEKGAGAQAMVDDGLYLKVPVPDIVLGGHVMPYRTGTLFIQFTSMPETDH